MRAADGTKCTGIRNKHDSSLQATKIACLRGTVYRAQHCHRGEASRENHARAKPLHGVRKYLAFGFPTGSFSY